MKHAMIFLMLLLSLSVYAATVKSVEPGTEEGTVSKAWVVDALKNGYDNVVFIDARPNDYYDKQHTDTIGHLDPEIFYEDNGCAKAQAMLPKDKIVVLICPGPRAQESWHNLNDSVADGGCGYKGGNVFWIRTDMTYYKDHIEVK